jgi:hypothetical protein
MRGDDGLHDCEMETPSDGYGAAIEDCFENEKGEFWVGNGEYGSRVNYCPYCGAKAPSQFVIEHGPREMRYLDLWAEQRR